MMFRILMLIAFTAFIIFGIKSLSKEKIQRTNTQKAVVALSNFPLYDIATHVAKDTLETYMILPVGVDAHSYEPTPKDVARLYKSDLVIYSGAGLEPWIDGFEFKNRSVDMSLHVDIKEIQNNDEHHEHEGEHSSCGEHSKDPHYWLDIANMIKATKYITNELILIYPNNEKFYIQNRDSYIEMLQKLDSDYKKALNSCKLNTIVVNHNAFSYLSSKYGFGVEALSALSPEVQPSAKTMASLIEHVQEHKLNTVFFESFASDKAIKSIASEAKVMVDVLHPLGNITADDEKAKLTYEDIMRSNLKRISDSMECVNEL